MKFDRSFDNSAESYISSFEISRVLFERRHTILVKGTGVFQIMHLTS